ncbi:hypothetical protein P3T37_006172 [Kitasatospora sp. MAA4]|nr:hypothetical protein [Kitasatospora sp. MAA4]
MRQARQQRLVSEEPLTVWAVLAEAALRQEVGGAAVMRNQLGHLEQMTELSNVTVQGIPFRAGAHASTAGPYVILSFPSASALDVVLLDNPSGSRWFEGSQDVQTYHGLWNDARTKALSPVESRNLIALIKECGP